MAKGRTEYRFPSRGKTIRATETVNIWLNTNGFTGYEKDGEVYYRQGSSMTRWACLKYTVEDHVLIVYAWLDSIREIPVEEGVSPAVLDYRSMLEPLLTELNALACEEVQMGQIPAERHLTEEETQTLVNRFQQKKEKKGGNMAVAGMIIGIAALILNGLAFIGLPVMIGGLGCALGIVFSIGGLKTAKKGMAVTGLICSGLAAVLLIVKLVLTIGDF